MLLSTGATIAHRPAAVCAWSTCRQPMPSNAAEFSTSGKLATESPTVITAVRICRRRLQRCRPQHSHSPSRRRHLLHRPTFAVCSSSRRRQSPFDQSITMIDTTSRAWTSTSHGRTAMCRCLRRRQLISCHRSNRRLRLTPPPTSLSTALPTACHRGPHRSFATWCAPHLDDRLLSWSLSSVAHRAA